MSLSKKLEELVLRNYKKMDEELDEAQIKVLTQTAKAGDAMEVRFNTYAGVITISPGYNGTFSTSQDIEAVEMVWNSVKQRWDYVPVKPAAPKENEYGEVHP